MASTVFRIGDQQVSIGAGLRYWAESPDRGAEGARRAFVIFTLLFPR